MSEETGESRPNPAALSIPDAARLLSRASGRPVTKAMLQSDIAAGAPTNGDGTLNLVHYTAWLVKASHSEGASHAA